MSAAALADVLRHPGIWRGHSAHSLAGQRTGIRLLDQHLPGRGWPQGALIELLPAQPGSGELTLLLPSLRQQAQSWVAPPHTPYAPALAAAGIDLKQLLLVRPDTAQETLWAMEQILRSGVYSHVLGWLNEASMQDLRRLQLAAESGACRAFLFRPSSAVQQASPAALRIYLQAAESGLYLRILKCRGARPTAFICPQTADDTLALSAPASIAAGCPAYRAA